MSKNSLVSLIGQYSSDSEDEGEKQLNQEVNHVQRKSSSLLLTLPTTNWTECIDKATGHPYYWNVETKDVTWERPKEYDNYLNCLLSSEIKVPRNSWIRGYSDGSTNPYYVNEYTRVVVWEKPPDFKEPNEADVITLSNGTESLHKMELKRQILDEEKTESTVKSLDKKIHIDGNKDYKETNLLEQDKNIGMNLVAAYTTDDSDSNEEDGQGDSEESLKVISGKTFASIITGGNTETCFDEEIDKLKRELEETSSISSNPELRQDGKIDEALNFDEKTFQRKKRIQFKTNRKVNAEVTTQPILTETPPVDDFKKKKKKNNTYSYFQRSHVEFVKSETQSESSPISKNIDTNEIDYLSDLILEKVKFLSTGRPEVSAVQAISFQLETLLTAFRLSALDQEYLFKWLKTTSDDLLKLEQNAVPEGWKCTWDREKSQYCYTNLNTGEIQWDFPINEKELELINGNKDQHESNTDKENNHNAEDILCGEDEMDISTTPPPNADEQLQANETKWDESNPPPPPIISDANKGNLSCELASFYQDIAALETQPAATTAAGEDSFQLSDTDSRSALSPSSLDQTGMESNQSLKKRSSTDSECIKKKKKKVKVQGLGLKMKEVSEMVANWKKAQQELED